MNLLMPRVAYEVAQSPVGGVGCQGCGAESTVLVLVHAVGDCNSGQLDPDGNFVWNGCDRCLHNWQRELQGLFGRLRHHGPIICLGCGKPLGSVSDVMVRTHRLRPAQVAS